MARLLYAGPGIDRLHAEFAARGRIDTGAPVTARREVLVVAPAAAVWDVLSDPRRWGRIDPAIRDVRERHTRLVSEESMAGPLLPLFFGSAKMAGALEAWLAAIKAAAERAAP